MKSVVAGLLALLLITRVSLGGSIDVVQDEAMKRFVNDFIVLTEVHDVINIRVIALSSEGECAEPSPDTCPKQKLYIAVANSDSPPIRQLFEIEPSYGWEFLGWKSFPSDPDRSDEFAVFELRKRSIEKDAAGYYIWKYEYFDVSVNTSNAFLERRTHQ